MLVEHSAYKSPVVSDLSLWQTPLATVVSEPLAYGLWQQKLVAPFRQLCYGILAQLVEDISLCRKNRAGKSLIEFCQ